MIGLGREPQGEHGKRMKAPEGGDRFVLWRGSQASPQYFCRRSAASSLFLARILGLTPQAMYLSPLRGSRSHGRMTTFRQDSARCGKARENPRYLLRAQDPGKPRFGWTVPHYGRENA